MTTTCWLSIPTAEDRRLLEERKRRKNWKRWGPYLSERQWGTVREDYSASGDAWNHLSHEQSRSVAYRWGEDGLLGWCDRQARLCFSMALWNGRDAILKERLFGLTNGEGNHGEDVKEHYFYYRSTPTHSYAKAIYKYPMVEFPYAQLVSENRARNRHEREFEISDTGVFDAGYWDVEIEYAKDDKDADDTTIVISVFNRASSGEPQELVVIPTLWFRNTWSWGCESAGCTTKPKIVRASESSDSGVHIFPVDDKDDTTTKKGTPFGPFQFHIDESIENSVQEVKLIATDNETNYRRAYGDDAATQSAYTKDAFHRYVIDRDENAVHHLRGGGGNGGDGGSSDGSSSTKVGFVVRVNVAAGGSSTIRLRLQPLPRGGSAPATTTTTTTASSTTFPGVTATVVDTLLDKRRKECDEFYDSRIPSTLTDEEREVSLQAYSGLLWSKMYYYYVVEEWLKGDPRHPPPPPQRRNGRNNTWTHLHASDVMLVCDKWEYPWFAVWDLSFHVVALSAIDVDFAKKQLSLFLREWYMKSDGCLPAYEWNFGDTNPPVFAWSVWRVYKMSGPSGGRDVAWLASCFMKLLLNFSWWVNRKDMDGKGLFEGGFLGLDNIGIFDRSAPLPPGTVLEQADASGWMSFYCIIMLKIAVELGQSDPAYEDMASKFFEHHVQIADAINTFGGCGLWNDDDAFYYDQLRRGAPPAAATTTTTDTSTTSTTPLRIRSLVGLIPLYATGIIPSSHFDQLPDFARRTRWFLKHKKELAKNVTLLDADTSGYGDGGGGSGSSSSSGGRGGGGAAAATAAGGGIGGSSSSSEHHHLLAIVNEERLPRLLAYLFDENEFLSEFGIRSLSKYHDRHPFTLGDQTIAYVPGDSNTGMYGGNSNWRGPIWFPTTFLIIEALEHLGHFYGERMKFHFPTNDAKSPKLTLGEIALKVCERMLNLFLPAADGSGRPCHGGDEKFRDDKHWKKFIYFYEYFHGCTGRGLGASHQTGWTALVTNCNTKIGRDRQRQYLQQYSYFVDREATAADIRGGSGGDAGDGAFYITFGASTAYNELRLQPANRSIIWHQKYGFRFADDHSRTYHPALHQLLATHKPALVGDLLPTATASK